jgi:hypothetical protein
MDRALTAVAAIVAGILVALSPVLEWTRLNSAGVTFAQGGVGGSATGIDTGVFGWAAMILGAVLVGAALLSIAALPRRAASIAVLVGGAASLALAVFLFVTLESRFADYAVGEAASAMVPALKIRTLLDTLFDQGSISVGPGIGLILLGVGGAIGILAGIFGSRRTAPAKTLGRKLPAPQVPMPTRQSGKGKFGF